MKNLCKTITKSGKVCKKYKEKNCNSCSVHKLKEKCSICFENILEEKSLHCNHKYCLGCISKWIYIEQKDTCPLCRNLINDIDKYDAVKFCLQTKFITKREYTVYFIINEELKKYLDDIIVVDSGYDPVEWNTLINYIKLDPNMYSIFLNSSFNIFISYTLFDESIQGINNVIYEYVIRFNSF